MNRNAVTSPEGQKTVKAETPVTGTMARATATLAPVVHVFQSAGLGLAPFTCLGVEERRGPITLADGTQVGAPGQPMGTCAYCGTGIAACYLIQSADGKRFIVGCECVRKTGDAGLKRVVSALVAQARRAKREAAETVKVERVRAMLNDPAVQAKLSALPHPHAGMASDGRTMLDYIAFLWDHSMRSGQASLERRIITLTAQEVK